MLETKLKGQARVSHWRIAVERGAPCSKQENILTALFFLQILLQFCFSFNFILASLQNNRFLYGIFLHALCLVHTHTLLTPYTSSYPLHHLCSNLPSSIPLCLVLLLPSTPTALKPIQWPLCPLIPYLNIQFNTF